MPPLNGNIPVDNTENCAIIKNKNKNMRLIKADTKQTAKYDTNWEESDKGKN